MICKVCNNSKNNKEFQIKEMMFGFRDEFAYFECSQCGCLQTAEIPKNMQKYYPSNYYSLEKVQSDSFIKHILKRNRNEYALLKKGIIGRMICKKYPNTVFEIIGKIKINFNSIILDIGGGAGNLLYSLKQIGFKNLTGVDPYINEEIIDGDMKIIKKTIYELPDNQKFDLIMANHSLEHISDQIETLLKIRKLLSENGVCLIRMPVKTEYIWERYGVDWVQIDAPRHFFIHTLRSFELLVKKSGLVIQDVIFDSTEFQFWGSEEYKKDISQRAENSYSINPRRSIFTAKQIRDFKKKAKELNMNKQGDQAAFCLVTCKN